MPAAIKVLPVLKGAQPQITVPLAQPRTFGQGLTRDADGEAHRGGTAKPGAATKPDGGGLALAVYKAECTAAMTLLPEESVDLAFADPPYFLSNGGITCQAGKMVSVNKGKWDKSPGIAAMHEWNKEWLEACRKCLTKDGTIWVSGTNHVIYSVGFAMQELGFKILNHVTWVKPNPPPNLSCRYFTHASEEIIWAAKSDKSRHVFNYDEMKADNSGKQMKSVWEIYPPSNGEKKYGKHPTQKPVALLDRIIRASSNEGDIVMDPFLGSGTTAIAALRLGRKFIGFEVEDEYIRIAKKRIEDESPLFRQVRDKSSEIEFMSEVSKLAEKRE